MSSHLTRHRTVHVMTTRGWGWSTTRWSRRRRDSASGSHLRSSSWHARWTSSCLSSLLVYQLHKLWIVVRTTLEGSSVFHQVPEEALFFGIISLSDNIYFGYSVFLVSQSGDYGMKTTGMITAVLAKFNLSWKNIKIPNESVYKSFFHKNKEI